MILQYRGFNKNLVYEEADSVAIAIVKIPKFEEEEVSDTDKWKEAYRAIDEKIRKETNAINISDRTGKSLHTIGEVKAIIRYKEGKEETYLFDTKRVVYLLNDRGKTVARL